MPTQPQDTNPTENGPQNGAQALAADARPGTTPECPSAGCEDSRQAPNPPSPAPDATPGILSPQNASQQRTHREPQCPKCKTIWRQRGNATGHCRACCRTFDSLDAFDHHRVDGSCIDPAAWTRGDGTPLFESRTSTEGLDAGTTYWRMVPHPAAARWIEERRASHADSDR